MSCTKFVQGMGCRELRPEVQLTSAKAPHDDGQQDAVRPCHVPTQFLRTSLGCRSVQL